MNDQPQNPIMLDRYAERNREQTISEHDNSTKSRYRQMHRHLPAGARRVLEIGCNTGKGGEVLHSLDPSLHIIGLDCVAERLA